MLRQAASGLQAAWSASCAPALRGRARRGTRPPRGREGAGGRRVGRRPSRASASTRPNPARSHRTRREAARRHGRGSRPGCGRRRRAAHRQVAQRARRRRGWAARASNARGRVVLRAQSARAARRPEGRLREGSEKELRRSRRGQRGGLVQRGELQQQLESGLLASGVGAAAEHVCEERRSAQRGQSLGREDARLWEGSERFRRARACGLEGRRRRGDAPSASAGSAATTPWQPPPPPPPRPPRPRHPPRRRCVPRRAAAETVRSRWRPPAGPGGGFQGHGLAAS